MPTRPGIHASTNFEQYPNGFSQAIRAISKKFYITRSFDRIGVGNSEYWGMLARPSEDFSIHLNADRELLFIFSQYETFEIRTLESFDRFFDQLEQKRIDRSIRFLISNDPKIEGIIQHYLSQNPEYPIIVPIFLGDIVDSNDQILKNIRRNYLLRDLFSYQNPLREETFFFGRQEQVNTVLDLAKSGQSSSIFGLRKSGKTSVIYAIMRRCKSFGCIPVLVDCQSPSVHAKRYGGLLNQLVEDARTAIGHNKKIPNFSGSDAEISEQFGNQMKTTLSQSKSKFLFIFDEIENISPKTAASTHWSIDKDSILFWQNIRSFIQKDAQGNMAICLVGTSPLLLEEQFILGIANPMYLFSQKRFLPAFSLDETKAMIDRLGFFMGLEFDPIQIAQLQKTYGGHPFFIRQVCSIVHKNASNDRPVRVSDQKLSESIDEFGGQLESYLSGILDNLKEFYPDEFDLLGSVISGNRDEISEIGEEAPDLIDHLIGYGIVEKRGGDFDIRFDAIRTAVERIFRKKIGRDSIWTEIMIRRNHIETEIRSELFHFSKGQNPDTWRNILKDALTTKRYEQLRSIEPRYLFSISESPLYWTDLISLLKSKKIFPHIEQQRRTIISSMEIVNTHGRSDSHAKLPNFDNLERVRKAFDTLEAEFSPPA